MVAWAYKIKADSSLAATDLAWQTDPLVSHPRAVTA
jgi:hypothetical protein